MNETIKAKLTRLLPENPDVPIKVMVYKELTFDSTNWDTTRSIGELKDCEATEYVHYRPEDDEECFYVGRDNSSLWEIYSTISFISGLMKSSVHTHLPSLHRLMRRWFGHARAYQTTNSIA